MGWDMNESEKAEEGLRLREVPSVVNTTFYYIVAIILIMGIAFAGLIMVPEESGSILTFSGIVLVVFLSILKTQSDLLSLQERVHEAVNSKMDRLLKLIDESARAEGVLLGREQQKKVNSPEDNST